MPKPLTERLQQIRAFPHAYAPEHVQSIVDDTLTYLGQIERLLGVGWMLLQLSASHSESAKEYRWARPPRWENDGPAIQDASLTKATQLAYAEAFSERVVGAEAKSEDESR